MVVYWLSTLGINTPSPITPIDRLAPSQKLTCLVWTLVPPPLAGFAQCTMAIPGWTLAERGTFAKCITVLIQLSQEGLEHTHIHNMQKNQSIHWLLDTLPLNHKEKLNFHERFFEWITFQKTLWWASWGIDFKRGSRNWWNRWRKRWKISFQTNVNFLSLLSSLPLSSSPSFPFLCN